MTIYTQIDPNDRDAVVWLQLALARLYSGSVLVHPGQLDRLTQKALRNFQHQQGLPVTGEADEATLQLIQQLDI